MHILQLNQRVYVISLKKYGVLKKFKGYNDLEIELSNGKRVVTQWSDIRR